MPAQLKILRTQQDIETLKEYLKDHDIVAYDCETTGLLRTDQVIGVSVCADESVAFYVVLAEWNKDEGKLVDLGNYDAVVGLLELLKGKSLIMHNSIFDCAMAEHFFKVRLVDSLHTDTMVLAHILDENRKVGLKELAKQYFGANSTKEQQEMKASVEANGGSITKTSYEMYKADSELLGKYGAQDALLTYKLLYVLLEDLVEQDLWKFFYDDESIPLLKGPTYELNTTGLKVDRDALITLKKTLETECAEAKAYIYREIDKYTKDKYPGTTKKNVFNIGSSSQLAWLMFGQLKLEFGTLTDGGKDVCRAMGMRLPYSPAAKREFIDRCLSSIGHVYQEECSYHGEMDQYGKLTIKKTAAKKVKEPWAYIKCDKKILQKYEDRFEWVKRLLEYQRKTKILNTYVEGLEERILYGMIHPSFLQHGTTSGRYSSRNPNFQNLPRDDKRIKQCVIARPGKVFVGADYSQLEPRVFAYFSQDPALMQAFASSEDFYSVLGMRVYGKTDCTPHKEGSPDAFGVKYKKLRDLSKVIALASVYGATAHQLAPTTGKSIDDTQEDMDAYFNAFPGVKKFMKDSHDKAKKDGFVVNLFGRKRRIPEAGNIEIDEEHEDLPYEARTLLNLAVNHPIQSTGASIVNRAAIKIHELKQQLSLNSKLVVQVHDSLVYECDEKDAETMALILQEAMETTTELPGVLLEAQPKVGKNLAEV